MPHIFEVMFTDSGISIAVFLPGRSLKIWQKLWQDYEYVYAGSLFSVDYADRGHLFEGLSIWKNEKYRGIQLSDYLYRIY